MGVNFNTATRVTAADRSYRKMFMDVIGPILAYSKYSMNNDGIIHLTGTSSVIRLSGKCLYVPSDGADFFASKSSTILEIFNPFKIFEHVIILSNILCNIASNYYRDDEDEYEYDENGALRSIVLMVKRSPKTEDKLPAQFNGIIYEMWCRDNKDVIGQGIDHGGHDCTAIIMTLLDFLSKNTTLVPKDIDYVKLFKYVERCEVAKEKEIDIAKAQFSSNNTNMDFSNIESVDDMLFTTNGDLSNINESKHVIDNNHSFLEKESAFDDIEF